MLLTNEDTQPVGIIIFVTDGEWVEYKAASRKQYHAEPIMS
jgi:hypothetical protein